MIMFRINMIVRRLRRSMVVRRISIVLFLMCSCASSYYDCSD